MPNNQRGIAHILILLILVAGIGVGLFLVQHPTIFKPRASEGLIPYGGPNNVLCKFGANNLEIQGSCKMNILNPDSSEEGIKKVKISCYDGFEQTVDLENGCLTKHGLDLLANQICENHSSCSQLNGIDPQTTAYVQEVPGGYIVNLSSTGAQIKILHSAVWPLVATEDKAKSAYPQGIYQGFTPQGSDGWLEAKFFVGDPSYIEYYAIDSKYHKENLHKRSMSKNAPYMDLAIDFDDNTPPWYVNPDISFAKDNSKISYAYPTVKLDGEYGVYQSEGVSRFKFLVAGDHKLEYFIPYNYGATVEVCYKTNQCQKVSSEGGIGLGGKKVFATINIPTFEDKPMVKISYRNLEVPPPTKGLPRVDCSPGSSLNASFIMPKLSKFENHYVFRIDNKKDGWDGSCNSKAGDSCYDGLPAGQTIFSTHVAESNTYEWWYHEADSKGMLGPVSAKQSFICPSLPPEPSTPSAVPEPIPPRVGLNAKCVDGKLSVDWPVVDEAVNYKIRGGKDLTNRPDDSTWNNLAASKKIIADNITTCTYGLCVYNFSERATGEKIGKSDSYYLWLHSVDASGKVSPPIETSVICDDYHLLQ